MCIVEENSADVLIERFVEYLTEIQCAAAELMKDKLPDITDELDEELIELDDTNSEGETGERVSNVLDYRLKQLTRVRDSLKRYVKQIPVIGFNCSKYDLNLIKTRLVKHLRIASDSDKDMFVVKKCNQYMGIANRDFKFLDIGNFLAAGSSYDRFYQSISPRGRTQRIFLL